MLYFFQTTTISLLMVTNQLQKDPALQLKRKQKQQKSCFLFCQNTLENLNFTLNISQTVMQRVTISQCSAKTKASIVGAWIAGEIWLKVEMEDTKEENLMNWIAVKAHQVAGRFVWCCISINFYVNHIKGISILWKVK